MNPFKHPFNKAFSASSWKKLTATALLTAGSLTAIGAAMPVLALKESVPLEELNIEDVIFLPTVNAKRQVTFTKPKTWQLNGNTKLKMNFQHSLLLLPETSWLKILVNDKVVKHIPLTKENAELTSMEIPLPVGDLDDFNTLSFLVEQHYTDRCEDPTDASLWSQVLNSTSFEFDYSTTLPDVNLQTYPYPIIDTLAYAPAQIRYVLPSSPDTKTLQALGYVNMHMGQSTGGKELRTEVGLDGYAGAEHLVLVGTPTSNPAIKQFANAINATNSGVTLGSSGWQGSSVGNGDGVVVFFRHPQHQNKAVLVVSGNDADGVQQAAHYLTSRPMETSLQGNAVVADSSWRGNGARSSRVSDFIEKDSRTFAELGYGVQSVEKMTAPPIVYNFPVLSDFQHSNAEMMLDMTYSYGPGINPQFSSIEVRWNDVSIGNVPLLQQDSGEDRAQISIPVSSELIKPNNVVVAQFHLMPDKYGWCKGDYDDQAWGKVFDDSALRVTGSPKSILPNAGAFNYTGFPYARHDNFETTHFVLPANPSKENVKAFLAITGRLGRSTLADTDLRFTVGSGSEKAPANTNILAIGRVDSQMSLPAGNQLSWKDNSIWQRISDMKLSGGRQKIVQDENAGGIYMEQYSVSGDKVVTVFTSTTDIGLNKLSQIFENDKAFYNIGEGYIHQFGTSGILKNKDHMLFGSTAITNETHRVYREAEVSTPKALKWFERIPWKTVLWWIGGILLALILIPLLFNLIKRAFSRNNY